MKPIEIPTPKNKLEMLCFPKLVKVTEMKNESGIKLTIYKTSSILDIPKEMLDYEKESLDMHIPSLCRRAALRTGNIDLGTCDALVVRKWGAKECETVFSAILVRPFSDIDKAIYEEMMKRTFNKPKERLVLSFDNRREYPQGGIVGKERRNPRGEMVRQMTEEEKRIFEKFKPGATHEDYLQACKELERLCDELTEKFNKHTEFGQKLLEDSLRKFGAGRSILVPTDGKKLVVVQRTDLTLDSPEGREMALADNMTALKGIDPDSVTETVCKKGDIWKLGNHRLMCGDSTDAASVALLMDGGKADITFTSPPYNAGFGKCITKDNGRSKYTNGSDDDLPQSEYREFLQKSINNARASSEFSFFNIQMLANNKSAFVDILHDNVSNLADIIVWDKQRAQPAAAERVLNSVVEFVLVFSDKGTRAIGVKKFHGTLENIIHIPPKRNEFSAEHNAVFPIDLPTHFINNFSEKSVLDLFGGSGTTLIAAEQLNRKCYMMELDPHYCDVIIARWEKLTGNKAERISNGND